MFNHHNIRRRSTSFNSLEVIAFSLALCACASSGPPATQQVAPRSIDPTIPTTPLLVATPGLTPKQRVTKAIQLLAEGDAARARPEIETFLADQPGNDLGKSLLAQLDEDPKVLLGVQSYPYKIQSGETLSVLADRYLGDRFMFYALARYNGIAIPSQSEVGRVIQIPGVPRKVAPATSRATRSDEDVIRTRLDAAKPAAKPTSSARDPGRASRLRGQALDLMSRGVIDRAVALLQQAMTFDPGNALIQADLDRARRILTGVRGR